MTEPSSNPELELIARAQGGDRQAFGELVGLHRQGVINVVYRMCGDMHLAEDAAQEAFIRAWQHLSSYKPRSAFRNWLYRIAANAALDSLRKPHHKRENVDLEALPLANPTQGVEARIEAQERKARVRQAVLALPPASRAALVLREYEGLSYREIAETLDIPIGTVMSRLSYARKTLYETLSPYLEVL